MNCSYRLGRLKRQQASDKLRFLHRSYLRAKQNGGFAPKRKTGAAAKQTAAVTDDQRTIEPSNHRTIEPSNQKSQMDQEYGLLLADARRQIEI